MKFKLLGNIYELSQIESISDLIPPSERKFDDREFSHDNERDWMNRFIIVFNTEKVLTITQYDLDITTLEHLIKLHSELVNFWMNPIKYIPSFK